MSQERSPSQPEGRDSFQSVLVLRKLTRAVADTLRGQMMDYLAALTPLLRPKTVLGDYIQGGQKEPARKADKAYKELQSLYESIATSKPFNLPRDLKPPLDVAGMSLEVTPLEYTHVVQASGEKRTITVRSPLTWVLTYSGFSPARLKELLENRIRASDDLQRFVLSYLAMHVVTTNQPGVTQILDALHFPISSSHSPELSGLPITRIGVAVSTSRPSDDVLVQSAELSGMDVFEEVVNVQDIPNLRDPLKARLLDIVRSQAPELVTSNS
jgi:hypothetical protein